MKNQIEITKSTVATFLGIAAGLFAIAAAYKIGQATTLPGIDQLIAGPVVVLTASLAGLVLIGICAFMFMWGAEHGSEEEKERLAALQEQVNRNLRIANSEMRRALEVSRTMPGIKDRSIKFYKYIEAVHNGEMSIYDAMQLANRYFTREEHSQLIKAIPEEQDRPE